MVGIFYPASSPISEMNNTFADESSIQKRDGFPWISSHPAVMHYFKKKTQILFMLMTGLIMGGLDHTAGERK